MLSHGVIYLWIQKFRSQTWILIRIWNIPVSLNQLKVPVPGKLESNSLVKRPIDWFHFSDKAQILCGYTGRTIFKQWIADLQREWERRKKKQCGQSPSCSWQLGQQPTCSVAAPGRQPSEACYWLIARGGKQHKNCWSRHLVGRRHGRTMCDADFGQSFRSVLHPFLT